MLWSCGWFRLLMYPKEAKALAWMSRKKLGAAAAAAAGAAAESLAVAVVFDVSLTAATICADATGAAAVRAGSRPNAAKRCRSKGPPSDVSERLGALAPSGE